MAKIEVKVHGKTADIYTPYDWEFVRRVKNIKGRKWNAEEKCWRIPISALDTCREIMNDVYGESDLGPSPKKLAALAAARQAAQDEAKRQAEAKAAEVAREKEQRAKFARGDRATDGWKGTEKQIAWAEQIVASARVAVDEAFEDLMAYYEARHYATSKYHKYLIEYAKDGYHNAVVYIDHMQNASRILDHRDDLSPELYRDPDYRQQAQDSENFSKMRHDQAKYFFNRWRDVPVVFSDWTLLWFRDKRDRGYDVYIKEKAKK